MSSDIQAALLGLLGVFFGMLISTLIQRWTIRSQLNHDSAEREKERQYELRRTVFEPVAEAVGVVPALLSELLAEKADLPGLSARFNVAMQTLAKASVVANEDLTDAISDFSKESGEALMSSLLRRMPLDSALSERDIAITFVEKALADQRSLLEMMKQHNLAGDPDRAAFARIQVQVQIASDDFSRHSKERDLAQEAVMRIMQENSKAALASVPVLTRRGAVVVARIRKELGFPVDEISFSEKAARNSSAAVDLARPALDQIYDDGKN